MSLKTHRRGRLALSACAALVCLAGAAPAFAGEAGGMRVVRDPVTGHLRAPTHDEFKAMEAQERKAKPQARSAAVMPQQSTATPEIRADGVKSMKLDESSMSYSVATRKPDGSVDMQCVTGSKAADAALKNRKFGAKVLTKEQAHELQ